MKGRRMSNLLKSLFNAWFFDHRNRLFGAEDGAMAYFRAEYKDEAQYAYEFWKSTGKSPSAS